MTKKETTTTKVPSNGTKVVKTSTETSSSKKSTPVKVAPKNGAVKVDLKKDLPSKVSLFKTIEVDTTKKMSLSDLGKSLVKLWDSTQKPSHFGLPNGGTSSSMRSLKRRKKGKSSTKRLLVRNFPSSSTPGR